MTPPPDGTPWWAWLLALVSVAAITSLTSWLTSRPAKREATAARAAAEVAAHEARPNSGGSMRDAINRIEQRQIDQGKDIGGIREELRMERAERRDGDKSIWDTLNREPWKPPPARDTN